MIAATQEHATYTQNQTFFNNEKVNHIMNIFTDLLNLSEIVTQQILSSY